MLGGCGKLSEPQHMPPVDYVCLPLGGCDKLSEPQLFYTHLFLRHPSVLHPSVL
jgi:hypothetical protein